MDANTNLYCILFHGTNYDCGNNEPLIYKKLPSMNIESSNDYLSPLLKDLQKYWKSIANKI